MSGMEIDMADAHNTNQIENPDELLNIRNVAAGGDGLIVQEGNDPVANDGGGLTNSNTNVPPPKLAKHSKAAGKRTPKPAEPIVEIYVPGRSRLERMEANNEVTPLDMLNTEQTYIDCPWCNKRTLTTVKRQAGAMTYDYACRLLCTTVIGFIIPYLFNCCQDIAHYCSECGNGVALQQYVYYEGAEGQKPAVFLPPRPRVVQTQHMVPPTAALPDTVKAQPQEMETRRSREMENRQPEEMETIHLREMENRQLQEMEDKHLQEMESLNQTSTSKPMQDQDIHHRTKRCRSI